MKEDLSMERTGASVAKNARMIRKYLHARMTANPVKRIRRLYEMYPSSYLFAERTHYINMGYWENGCRTLDDASEVLAALLADTAGFQPDDTILDVGFGYGDQDFAWLHDRKPRKIYGLNITPGQVEAARRRARREELGDRLDFRVGSATAMPFGADTFDRVVALESAQHFYPRSAFLKEAYRVLRPGGVLAAADVVPVDATIPRTGMRSLPLTWVAISVDEANWYSRDTYANELTELGFTQVRVRSIRDKVFEPWRRHIVAKLDDPAFQRRVGRMYHRMLKRMWSDQSLLKREMEMLDYVMVVATKPGV
jgi:erythromycin 3''-O-methyltransferase